MAINILLALIYLQNNYTKAASVQVALTPGPAECGMRIKNKKLNKGGEAAVSKRRAPMRKRAARAAPPCLHKPSRHTSRPKRSATGLGTKRRVARLRVRRAGQA